MKVSICYQWKRKSRNWNTKKFKSIIDYSQTTDDVCENLKDYNTTKKKRVLIVLDDTIADIKSNKKLTRINTELFSRGINLIFHLFLYHNLISKNLKLYS